MPRVQPSRRRGLRPSRGSAAARARDPRSLSDEALFEGVRGGSEPYFHALYDRYFDRIYSFIHQRVRNHADAEELTQETFTAVFRSVEGFSGRSSPLGWIYGIAKNTTYNHLRRKRLQDDRLDEAGPHVLVTDSATWTCTPEEHLSLDRYARALVQRLHSVSTWQAEAFYLRHVENRSIGEICRATERSSDAIRSGLYRVKRLLVEAEGRDAASLGA